MEVVRLSNVPYLSASFLFVTTNKKLPDTETSHVMPGVAARLLHVDPRTLQRMAERGEIEAVKLPSGHRRYSLESINAIRYPDEMCAS